MGVQFQYLFQSYLVCVQLSTSSVLAQYQLSANHVLHICHRSDASEEAGGAGSFGVKPDMGQRSILFSQGALAISR